MQMMPSISFETIMGFTWPRLKAWHNAAFDTYKTLNGVE
jgi:hypothetical protein